MSPELLFSQIVPLAFAAGLNVYATIAVIGLSGRFDLVSLPESLHVFENPPKGARLAGPVRQERIPA